jgi:DNA modification methylase
MTIYHGDCLDVMAFDLQPESVDAVVTDPPYGLSFMGKRWDHLAPGLEYWAAMLRVAKPGAYLLAFGGTRTVHRQTCAIEDAGWEIRDLLVWGYASGFPKSLDTERAIAITTCQTPGRHFANRIPDEVDRLELDHVCEMTPESEPFDGWGTALKPAWEPIVMARKPLQGTVAANATAHGTGSLNIDGSRIGTEAMPHIPGELGANGVYNRMSRSGEPSANRRYTEQGGTDFAALPGPRGGDAKGRWPSNIILTDPIFDGGAPGVVGGGPHQSNTSTSRGDIGTRGIFSPAKGYGPDPVPGIWYGDAGTYSKFFLIPKADKGEREPLGEVIGELRREDPDLTRRKNNHPTVKPVDLMRHLVRLVTPPGGTVLDPFLGSGTTGIACEMEGFDWIGIEREAEYVAIATARLEGVQRGMGLSA